MRIASAEAAERLGKDPRVVSRLLEAGLLGTVERGRGSRGARFVDEEIVDRLASLPVRSLDDLDEQTREVMENVGAFVIRLRPWGPDPSDPRRPGMGYHVDLAGTEDQHQAIDRWWALRPVSLNRIRGAIEERSGQPLIATVAGLVVERWKIVDLPEQNEHGKWRFELERPKAWASAFENAWLPTGGGGPWTWWPRFESDA